MFLFLLKMNQESTTAFLTRRTSMECGPRLKLFGLILLCTLLLTILYGLSQLVIQLFPSIPSSILLWLPLVITIICSLLSIFIFWDRLPEWYDEVEEDILMELTVHEESDIFRISFGLGSIITFGICVWFNLRWPFFLGIMTAGVAIWLYLVDIIMAIYVYGMDGWDELFSCTHHSCLPGFWLGALVWLLLGIIASGIIYHDLAIPTPVEINITNTQPLPIPEQEPSLWQRVQKQVDEWISNLEIPSDTKQQDNNSNPSNKPQDGNSNPSNKPQDSNSNP